MLNEALRSLQDSLAIKGVRRVLWFFLVITVFVAFFEAETNYFEIHSISARLELLEKVGQQPLSAEQSARVEKIKGDLLNEIEAVQAEKVSPSDQLEKILTRFIKGAWITVPFFWLIIKLTIFLAFKNQKEERDVRKYMLWFGWLGLSCMTWVATILGVVSIIWNASTSITISWFVFPIGSAFAFLIIFLWIALLRTILPNESKSDV